MLAVEGPISSIFLRVPGFRGQILSRIDFWDGIARLHLSVLLSNEFERFFRKFTRVLSNPDPGPSFPLPLNLPFAWKKSPS